jgi:DNA-binding NtrC family response regulator
MESEIFGYVSDDGGKASRGKIGRVKKASGGTLFLDEIDGLSAKLQKRIDRLLRDNVYETVGSRQSEAADVRIVAAASKSLSDPVGRSAVCRELQDQIGTVTLRIPPLRERKEDIPLLTGHLIEKFNSLNGKQIDGPSQEALAVLMAYDFPGNSRELERIIEYAHVICPDRYLQVQHLPDNLDRRSVGFPSPALTRVTAADSLMAVERNFIYKSLMRNAWNRKATAEEMGIHPTTLWRKMKRHNIEKPLRPRRRTKR